jgi:hypothetical protein
VVTCLQELDPVAEHLVDEPIGLVDTSGPHVAAEMLQLFRFRLYE